MPFERYAIYWTPPADSTLAAFGASWFGHDPSHQAEKVTVPSLSADLVDRATRSPRRYGLHATIKAPFRLAPSAGEAGLRDALTAFCAIRRQVRSGPLRLHRFPRYLALVPERERAELEWLAAECVTHFDPFRAPLSEADRARRAGALSPNDMRHLEQFGFPHIFDRFFFHITLAGPLEPKELERVEAALAPIVQPLTGQDFVLDGLSLVGDPGGDARFQLIRRFSLKA